MTYTKLETLAYKLKDLSSLRSLFEELNFDFTDDPINKDSWTEIQREMVTNARIVAIKNDYAICYIQTNTDSTKEWKGIASKIIKDKHGYCMVCAHNPNGLKWIFLSLSKEFSSSFSEVRHFSINIEGNKAPKNFVNFLENIKISTKSNSTSIASQLSNAFDLFAVQIHDELTVNVFEALKVLSEGIILDKSNKLVFDENTLKEIRESVFILLYRMIFILYAEDREIFPIHQKIYKTEFSFKWLREEWLLKPKTQKKIKEYDVQKRLWKFFKLIELGSINLEYARKDFFMKSYYGRLFDREINSKLENWKIQNHYLLNAISLLTRTHDGKGNYFFLDYTALETRHLGSIYEHLLECHLEIKDNKIAELPNAKDRKSSGSYYTPKYIVDYIVENTIGPLIDNIISKTNNKNNQIEKILELNILDPAMGSGHFLIGATNYIAHRICKIEDNGDSDSAFIERKRDVVRRCIYGVDLNPLAVDLAHVSLWLETLSSEKPLSFLSAHLKAGNSLIGSSIEDILKKQTTLIESNNDRARFKKTIQDFIMLENLDDDTSSAVKTKTEKYEKIQLPGTLYSELKLLLDAKQAESFDIDVPPLGDLVGKIGKNSHKIFDDKTKNLVVKTAADNSFFHWDLEFLDIFYDYDGNRKKNPGFDVVIGNPPYGVKLTENEQTLLNNKFKIGTTDTAQLMMAMAYRLLKENAIHGYIVPKALIFASNWKNIRKIFLNDLKILIDVGKVWEDVKLEQAVYIIKKNLNQKFYNNGIRIKEHLEAKNIIDKRYYELFGFYLSGITNEELKLGEKLSKLNKLEKYARNSRGAVYQKFISNKGEIKTMGGKQIKRYHMDGIYGYINKNQIKNKKAHVVKNSILVQRLVAHILKPVEHIKITATIPKINDFIIVDTINQLTIYDKSIDPFYILGLLNSKIVNWYAYRFIFGKAIRTMQFDNPTTNRIPIPRSNKLEKPFIKLVDQILKYNNEIYQNQITFLKHIKLNIELDNIPKKIKTFYEFTFKTLIDELEKQKTILSENNQSKLQKHFEKNKNEILELKKQIQKITKEINQMAYQLYGLNEKEIKIIEESTI